MIDFGDDTAGECFLVVHGNHPFPRCSATFDRLNNIRLMPVNPWPLLRPLPHKSSMRLRLVSHRNDVAAPSSAATTAHSNCNCRVAQDIHFVPVIGQGAGAPPRCSFPPTQMRLRRGLIPGSS